ncbi:MAG: hypothetical protein ACOCRZ_06760 [Halothermotrichaceae bacterium]
MKKVKQIVILMVISILILLSVPIYAVEYKPELSGNYENGERVYEDVSLLDDDSIETKIDKIYYFNNIWLKYRQKLSPSDYYYIKATFYDKDYKESDENDYKKIELEGNYTFKINEKLKSKLVLSHKNMDYFKKPESKYKQIGVDCKLTYDHNEYNQYIAAYNKDWKNYPHDETENKRTDLVSLDWKHDVNENLKINTGFDYKQELFKVECGKTNKYQKRLNIGFKLKL